MKVTKQVKDSNYGYTDVVFKVGVNLEGLWDISPNEEAFISNYCKVVQHEWLHKEIADILFNLYDEYEEYLVTKLSGTFDLIEEEETEKYLWQILK